MVVDFYMKLTLLKIDVITQVVDYEVEFPSSYLKSVVSWLKSVKSVKILLESIYDHLLDNILTRYERIVVAHGKLSVLF